MARNTAIINFSAPPKLAKMIIKQAKIEDKTRSQLLRDAFNSYIFTKRLKKVQQTGEVIAQKLGLETYDDIEEFFG